MIVTIDGPAGAGKSSAARTLAQRLGFEFLDTGAMYRAVTWAVLRAGVDPTDAEGVAKVAGDVTLSIAVDPDRPAVSVDGTPVDSEIRGPEVTATVSTVAAVPAVRRVLVTQQRDIIAGAGRIVVEGRDIGSVVAPDADLKVYLTASSDARAQRRSTEQDTDLAATAEALARLDQIDSTRTTDPLVRVDGAVEVDTTAMDIDEVVSRLLALTGAVR